MMTCADDKAGGVIIKSYIICTTPRSGSTLLCKLLGSTGRTGNPDSFYYRAEFMREWAAEWGLPDPETVSRLDFDVAYLAAAVEAGKGGTPIFGMRLQQGYLQFLSETLGTMFPDVTSDVHRFERAFGTVLYLHLTRSDKIAQAISLVKAEQSGLWHRNADGSEMERTAAPREPWYDFKAIHQEVLAFARGEDAWRHWFDHHHIKPHHISYESLSDHPGDTVQDICRALGVEPPEIGAIKPEVAKLSDEVSLAWKDRYQSDLAKVSG